MSERIASLEGRIETLERELRGLRESIASMQQGRVPDSPAPSFAAPQREDASEEILSWVGKSSLLPRISALCFLLVVALILRTLTDSDILDKQIGSWVGMSYAALLIGVGWYQYARETPLAPIFAVSGAVLMYTIVVELHAHFASLPSIPAYFILVLTGMAMATISYLYGSSLPVMVGTLGLGIAGLAIDYPNPYYPHLAVVLLAANLMGAYATRLRSCSWLRWLLVLLTAVMIQVWGVKLGLQIGRGGGGDDLGLSWYLPVVAVFGLSYLGIAVLAAVRGGVTKVSRFDLALPTVSGLWAFFAAFYLVNLWWESPAWLAAAGVAAATLHYGIAFRLMQRRVGPQSSVNAYILAGTALMAAALALLVGALVSVALVSLLALGLAALSGRWENGGMRAFSYLLQVGAGAALAAIVLDRPPGEGLPHVFLASGALSLVALLHFRWARTRPLPAQSAFFKKIDANDRTAVFLLMVSLISGFFLLRAGLYQGALFAGEVVDAVFRGGQTVIVNFAAAGLLLYSFGRRDKELRNVAIFVAIVGAGRVFLLDLFGLRGVPLVASVFSFGLGIMLISVALSRWQKLEAREAGKLADSPEGMEGCSALPPPKNFF